MLPQTTVYGKNTSVLLPGDTSSKAEKMSVRMLQTQLLDELKDLYLAEEEIVRALSLLAMVASVPELQRTVEAHLDRIQKQILRLDNGFNDIVR